MTTTVLTDDLVVDILSRLSLKSFCPFKCVCKTWLSFSSDPHYSQKLSRTHVGVLYQNVDHGSAIHLARLSLGDKDIDTTLSFVPCYDHHIELKDCSNGLILCYHGSTHSIEISDAIVCNPATQEWMALPNTKPRSDVLFYAYLKLCFDPLWSQHFYVFKFEESNSGDTEVKVFFSEDATWSSCLWETSDIFCGNSLFVNGVLYMVHLWDNYLLALDAPNTCTHALNHRTLRLPEFLNGPYHVLDCVNGCLSESYGVLCYAQQELDGSMMRISKLEGFDRWVVKHHLSMNSIFGKDVLLRTNYQRLWYFDYDILAFDLEREVVILVEKTTNKVLSYSISSGKGSQILNIPRFIHRNQSQFYVPYCCKFPASVLQGAQN